MISNIFSREEKKEKTTPFIEEFKKQPLQRRLDITNTILKKNEYAKIPIIIDIYGDIDTKNRIKLNNHKFIVSKNILVSEFILKLRKNLNINSYESIFLLTNNNLLNTNDLLNIIYEKYKHEDNFLYIIITVEKTFGN
tara:strand:- start:303 stop:716 length:414 start_codon:yes stop_codon:yes gene_type:complete